MLEKHISGSASLISEMFCFCPSYLRLHWTSLCAARSIFFHASLAARCSRRNTKETNNKKMSTVNNRNNRQKKKIVTDKQHKTTAEDIWNLILRPSAATASTTPHSHRMELGNK
eukprot:gene13314-9150_t